MTGKSTKNSGKPTTSSLFIAILGWFTVGFGLVVLGLVIVGKDFWGYTQTLERWIVFGFSLCLMFYLGEKAPLSDENRWRRTGDWKRLTFGVLALLTALFTGAILDVAIHRESLTFGFVLVPIPVAWYLFYKKGDNAYFQVAILMGVQFLMLVIVGWGKISWFQLVVVMLIKAAVGQLSRRRYPPHVNQFLLFNWRITLCSSALLGFRPFLALP